MYDFLHKPLQLGSLTLRHRLVLPPMATEKAADGRITPALIAYYREMAQGDPALVIQEHCYVAPEGKASPHQIGMDGTADMAALKKLTAAVHACGVPFLAQLSHAGSAAHRAVTGLPVVGPSAVKNPGKLAAVGGVSPDLPEALDQDGLDRIRQAFVDAALRAKEAGYDGVEIHAAHGYLLDQFYSPLTNHRTDEYTGSTLEGRTRYLQEVCRAVRQAVGPDFVVTLRLGAADYMPGGATVEEVPRAISLLQQAGVDGFSISGGMSAFFRPGHTEPGYFAELSRAAKSATALPVMLAGGITTGEQAERLLEEGRADLIGIARAALKDHQIFRKIVDPVAQRS